MRTTICHRSVALFVLCISAACAPAASESRSTPRISDEVGQVQVTNDGRQDFVLYMVRDGMRYRLGRVARMETARFRIPPADVGPNPSYRVQLIAEPVGGGSRPFSTGSILWRPGQSLDGRVAGPYTNVNFVLVTR